MFQKTACYEQLLKIDQLVMVACGHLCIISLIVDKGSYALKAPFKVLRIPFLKKKS
jgi:hypothetical protein